MKDLSMPKGESSHWESAPSGEAGAKFVASRPSWAVVYIERQNSSLADTYGKHMLAGLVRLLPGEENVTLRVFVDKSIIEVFAMGGRTAVTGRVYPTLVATGIGGYSSGHGLPPAGFIARAYEMGSALG
jgi:sucrose-6-phosphate hydrolase SacC (GH32 family)